MAVAQSKLTAQGQISVPREVRRKLGVGPGSTIEWEERGDVMIVRRAKKYGMRELHDALFPPSAPRPKKRAATVEDMNVSIAAYLRKKHARR